ncbi:flagellin N-terminal helical domain-containing protein [Devosia rhizoryzae]|uniref:Flagellin n=1 Tax=Devosia rhizoryzae TaxID=2774137 RepID=A0ABX7CAM8_9HYPH|nr:flagellin [Devosia rhizoryzae]QQR40269.1 hypothetical protein JI748_04455 [Devosia rhizoryzae]
MANINLSAAVRSNLSSLQNTASLMSKTSDRLSSGNKVNSALDNPTNFFTASSLNSRAGDLNSLMDSMANGIKTIEAANNGLSAITKNLESMQSTLRQARQDKSFQTSSYSLDGSQSGSLSLKGGAIGDTGVEVALNSATPASLTSQVKYDAAAKGAKDVKANTAYDPALVDVSTTALSFDIKGNKDDLAINITIDKDTAGIADHKKVTADELLAVTNKKLADYGSTVRLRKDGDKLEMYDSNAANTGGSASINLTATNANAVKLGFTATDADAGIAVGGTNTVVSTAGVNAKTFGITIDGNGAGATTTPGAGSIDVTLDGDIHDTAEKAAAFINVKFAEAAATAAKAGSTVVQREAAASVKGLTASVRDGKLVISGPADGTAKTISVTETDGGTNEVPLLMGAEPVSVTASQGTGPAKTVDALIHEINNNKDLAGKVRASNDNGKLRIENLSTEDLLVDGASSTGVVDGTSAGASKIGGNSVRAGLADQFNELRDQLDKLSDDASFNGINLLRGDNLKITFNETGTSSMDIQIKGGETLNAGKLSLSDIVAKNLDSDTDIDAFLGNIKEALNTVRSQASAFGSNLSIVQNRQDFTKSMINTLETGAGNLTLADMNQEAANMMALQTRQSLASSTLSMANQADQSVLQLLR